MKRWNESKGAELSLSLTETQTVDFCTVAHMQIRPLGILSGSTAPYSDDAVRGSGGGN